MGAKTVYLFAALGAVSMALQIACCFLPMHSLTFFLGPLVSVGRFHTYLLSYQAQEGSVLFCSSSKLKSFKIVKDFCGHLEGPSELSDVAQRFCAPAVKQVFPVFCEGFQLAYYTGLVTLCVIILNVATVCISCYLLMDYVNRSVKQSTRMSAMIVHSVGTFLLVAALAIYAGLTLSKLGEMGGNSVFPFVPVSATGTPGYGFIGLWVAVLIQLIMLALSSKLSTSSEITDEERAEAKMRAELAADYGATGSGGAAPLGNQQQPGYDNGAPYGAAPGYGAAPPAFGAPPPAFGAPPPAFSNVGPPPAQGMMPPPQAAAFPGGLGMPAPGPVPAW